MGVDIASSILPDGCLNMECLNARCCNELYNAQHLNKARGLHSDQGLFHSVMPRGPVRFSNDHNLILCDQR